jgi:ABC-type nitrate/sulfonate/bicarbonate transport system permease component
MTRVAFRAQISKPMAWAAAAAEPTLVVIFFFAIWEFASRAGFVSARDFPPFTVILRALFQDMLGHQLWYGAAVTMGAWALGLLLVIATAIPIGIFLGSSNVAYRATLLTLEFFRTIPSIAALPILIFLCGVGFQLALVLVILTAIWPLLIQTSHGVHDVDPIMKDMGRVYGLGRAKQLLMIVLPNAAPYIATGLRLSGTLALVLSIAASLVAGGEGLGALIVAAAESAQVPLVYARLLFSGLLGLGVSYGLLSVERHFLRWHQSQRGRA